MRPPPAPAIRAAREPPGRRTFRTAAVRTPPARVAARRAAAGRDDCRARAARRPLRAPGVQRPQVAGAGPPGAGVATAGERRRSRAAGDQHDDSDTAEQHGKRGVEAGGTGQPGPGAGRPGPGRIGQVPRQPRRGAPSSSPTPIAGQPCRTDAASRPTTRAIARRRAGPDKREHRPSEMPSERSRVSAPRPGRPGHSASPRARASSRRREVVGDSQQSPTRPPAAGVVVRVEQLVELRLGVAPFIPVRPGSVLIPVSVFVSPARLER